MNNVTIVLDVLRKSFHLEYSSPLLIALAQNMSLLPLVGIPRNIIYMGQLRWSNMVIKGVLY